jgi:hypothetical protein
MFSDGASGLEGTLTDCSSNYEGWAEAVKESEDEDELVAIFEEIAQNALDQRKSTKAAEVDLAIEINEMEEGDRKDKHGELIDLLDDPQSDCNDALKTFQEEMQDNEDACEAYFDWQEDKEKEWEDWDDEVKERGEKCSEKDADKQADCFQFDVRKAFEAVPGPEKAYDKDSCSEKKDDDD